jgi:hypothetical protein
MQIPDWLTSTYFLFIFGLAMFVFGSFMAWLRFKNEILMWKYLSKATEWETPKMFKERSGAAFDGDAAVYCRWKTNGPMYQRLKGLFEQGIAPDPDAWSIHTYASALSLGDAHGEQMEVLCANSDLGRPPPEMPKVSEV